jgi:hypothetical protein
LKDIELEVWKNTNGEWLIAMDGVILKRSRFESRVRNLAEDVIEQNPEIKFHVIG